MGRRGRPRHPDILTPREWEFLALLRDGLTNPEIAERLGIGRETVKYHVSQILGKLGVDSRREAATWTSTGKGRRWWLPSAAPLLFWRRLGITWLSPVLTATLAIAVAAGVGVLVWALLATRDDGDRSANGTLDTVVSAPGPSPTQTTGPGQVAVPGARPLSEDDALWQEVADTATSIDPILRLTHVPTLITKVQIQSADITAFTVSYRESTGLLLVSVSGGALNPGMPGLDGLDEIVEIRGIRATYRRQDRDEPLSTAFVFWEEPGRLGEPGRPEGPNLDHVTYMVSSTGLAKEELLRVANSLVPFAR